MEVIVETDRDRRTLVWLIEQVGDEAVQKACAQLVGHRKPFVSNISKVLGLVPPESVLGPSRKEAKERLGALKAILKKR
jgi:hypothetical protein